MTNPTPDLTQTLQDAREGDGHAADQLLPAMYDELKRLAVQIGQTRGSHSLQGTEIVHEAYLRLIDQKRVDWKDRVHFKAVAALVIRRVLLDHARFRNREKRGGGLDRVTLDVQLLGSKRADLDPVDLEDLLQEFEKEHARAARVVEYRFLGGLTMEEIAHQLEASVATVERDWRFARAWLFSQLGESNEDK